MESSGEELYKEIAARLQSWCSTRCRRFPWREKADPYTILLAEFLLQRTKAETVAKFFVQMLSRYKDIRELASARKEELDELFSRLGLSYRAERLLETATMIVERYGGEIPCDMNRLLKLRGVGVYMASAILNFGCNIPTPVIDKNVMRVMNRLFNVTGESVGREMILKLYKYGDSKVLAYALIDLGATVCTEPPRCDECPLDSICAKHPLRKKEWRMLRKELQRGKVTLYEQPVK
jgi:A/G-specific adenine glycosylase